MDPENGPLEECFPLPTSGFEGPWDRLPGCKPPAGDCAIYFIHHRAFRPDFCEITPVPPGQTFPTLQEATLAFPRGFAPHQAQGVGRNGTRGRPAESDMKTQDLTGFA